MTQFKKIFAVGSILILISLSNHDNLRFVLSNPFLSIYFYSKCTNACVDTLDIYTGTLSTQEHTFYKGL